jgi:hypothetical protein
MEIKIVVASHKVYPMPTEDIYLPLHVGKELSDKDFGFKGDNIGDNISSKNQSYNELTALYWIWKNINADYKGLAHYRRYFSIDGKNPITKREAVKLCTDSEVIVPISKKFYIISAYFHYTRSQKKMINIHTKDLDTLRDVIEELYPNYLETFNAKIKSRKLHMCNMFIMKNELFHKYCSFLFDVIEEVEHRIPSRLRVYGALSEFLLDTFLENNQILYKEVKMLELEKKSFCEKLKDRIKQAL